jgi:multicomponent Na+:H+ antiporter subunit F
MQAPLWLAALFLLLNLMAGLARIYFGPRPADRMQALLLFGTTTVAVLLLLAYAMEMAALIDVALVFVMLAALGSLAFVALPVSIQGRAAQGQALRDDDAAKQAPDRDRPEGAGS